MTTTITQTDINVGKRIASRRREIRMSQVALADQIGISFQQVQKYERGANRVGAGRLNDIAKSLGVPINYFFQDNQPDGGKVMECSATNIMSNISNEAELKLMRAFRKIDDDSVRSHLIEMVEQIASSKD